MFNKIIVLYSLITTLNYTFKLSTCTDLSKNLKYSVQNNREINMTGSTYNNDKDIWQPIMRTNKWLAAPTMLTPLISTPLWQSSNFDINSNNSEKIHQQTYHNYAFNHHYNLHHSNQKQQPYQLHRSGNYVKRHVKTLIPKALKTSLSLLTPPTPLTTGKYEKFMSHMLNISNSSDNNSVNNNGINQINYHHHKQQHQRYYPLNNTKTQYLQTQISGDIIKQQHQPSQSQLNSQNNGNSMSSQFNLHHIADAEHKYRHHLQRHQNMSSDWHYPMQQQLLNGTKQHVSSIPENATLTINSNKFMNNKINTSVNINNFIDVILKKTLNAFQTNGILNDNEITKFLHNQYHNSNTNNRQIVQHSGDKTVTTMITTNENQTKEANIGTSVAVANDDGKNLNAKLLPLEKTFNLNKNINFNNSNGNNGTDNDDANANSSNIYNDYITKEDKIDEYNDIKITNSSLYQIMVNATSKIMGLATTIEKMDLLNTKKIALFTTPLIDEVQGRKTQNDEESKMKYSFILPQVLVDKEQDIRSTDIPAATDTQTGRQLSLAPKSKDLSTSIISGRKVKKIKNFQWFIFPLLLAYKLKFITLIPMLIGGLILLVGTAGIAGFFFALFTAVMSLKSGSHSSIVVKDH